MAPTSERLFRLLLLGLKRTSLKSSLRSASTRGILDAQNTDDQGEEDEYAEENPLRKATTAVVVAGPKPQPPNPNLQAASVFIAKRGPAQPRPPWLYLGLDSLSLSLSLSLYPPPLLQRPLSPSSPSAEWRQHQWPSWQARLPDAHTPTTHTHTHTNIVSSTRRHGSTAVACVLQCVRAHLLSGWGIAPSAAQRQTEGEMWRHRGGQTGAHWQKMESGLGSHGGWIMCRGEHNASTRLFTYVIYLSFPFHLSLFCCAFVLCQLCIPSYTYQYIAF